VAVAVAVDGVEVQGGAALGMIVGWLIGPAVIALLWQRSASFYFRTAPRYRARVITSPGAPSPHGGR